MPRRKQQTETTTFIVTLRTALEHFADACWLGTYSPLASPYFLGKYLQDNPQADSQTGRGSVFQTLVREVMADMWGTDLPITRDEMVAAVDAERLVSGNAGSRYYFYLLELRYIRHYFAADTYPIKVFSMPGFVNVSSSRFFIHLERAMDLLAELLLKRLRPTFRLEQPVLQGKMVGREDVRTACLTHLQADQSVALSGLGGMGKTMMATAVCGDWSTSTTFWFTFRPGFNDRLGSVLFTLGHFLHQREASNLWLHLLANKDHPLQPEQALGFLRNDLHTLSVRLPLFCFDEVDILRADDPAHVAVLELLESLKMLVPLLLVGQTVDIDTAVHYALTGFNLDQTRLFLQEAGIDLSDQQLQYWHKHTQGNPRLLQMITALYHSGEDITDLGRKPAVRPLLQRLWKRLTPAERGMMEALAVFRTFVPRDAWPDEEEAVSSLISRRLVQVDAQGGMALLPLFRSLMYEELFPEQREVLHQQAYVIRAQEGEFTSAAYHLVQAGDMETAVSMWYARYQYEIERGQADAARAIFLPIPWQSVTGQARKELKLLQNELHRLTGAADEMLNGMEKLDWSVEAITATAYHQWGMAYAMKGQLDAALDKYGDALSTLSQLTHQMTELHFRRGQMYAQQGNLPQARKEAKLAQYEAERLQGLVAFFAGELQTAVAHFHTALDYAQQTQQEAPVAYIHRWLMYGYGQLGDIEQAKYHAHQAIAYFERTGDRLQAAGIRAEIAGLHIQVKQFANVIEPAEEALRYFEMVDHDLWISTTCSNLAEAYLETGDLEKAQRYAQRVLQREDVRTFPYALYTLGLVYQRQNQNEYAETCFRDGLAVAQQNEDKLVQAYLQRALGLLHDSPDILQTALQLFQEIGLAAEMEETEGHLERLT